MQANQNPEFIPFLKRSISSENIQVFQLAGDASTRRYYRVVDGQKSWVLMQWEPFKDDENYPFLSVQGHFLKSGVAVPEIVSKSPSEGLVLLEDLGDLTLERKFWENQSHEAALPFYKQAVDELIKIHYTASSRKDNCTAFRIAFDTEKFLWEMNYGKTHLIENLCKIKMTAEETKQLEVIFTSICSTLDKEPKFISHRDYHSRNLMLKHGTMRVIDFQDARMGPVHYDLVSLIRDSYVDLDDKMADEIISDYFDKRVDAGLGKLNPEKFQEIYEMQSVQRCFKACGSFASFYNLRQDTRYLKYLVPTLKRVKKSIAYFPKYRAFGDILESHGVFERDFVVS